MATKQKISQIFTLFLAVGDGNECESAFWGSSSRSVFNISRQIPQHSDIELISITGLWGQVDKPDSVELPADRHTLWRSSRNWRNANKVLSHFQIFHCSSSSEVTAGTKQPCDRLSIFSMSLGKYQAIHERERGSLENVANPEGIPFRSSL